MPSSSTCNTLEDNYYNYFTHLQVQFHKLHPEVNRQTHAHLNKARSAVNFEQHRTMKTTILN